MLFEPRDKPKICNNDHKANIGDFTGWDKCPRCREMVHAMELEKNQRCCPRCDYHFRLSGTERIAQLADPGSFEELFKEVDSSDQLGFSDLAPYTDRLAKAKLDSGVSEAVRVGRAQIMGHHVFLGIFEFQFMGGSMGSVVGERLTRLIESAVIEHTPVIIVSASGGARMQESVFSLMQMAKISGALARLHDAGIGFISVLTNPTSGGVTASFASLGDIILAEPDALICFTGPRVIEQVIREKLPPGFQKSEFLLERGFIDAIANRHELKSKLAAYLSYLT